jgi:hypothetical protein
MLTGFKINGSEIIAIYDDGVEQAWISGCSDKGAVRELKRLNRRYGFDPRNPSDCVCDRVPCTYDADFGCGLPTS